MRRNSCSCSPVMWHSLIAKAPSDLSCIARLGVMFARRACQAAAQARRAAERGRTSTETAALGSATRAECGAMHAATVWISYVGYGSALAAVLT